MRYLAVIMAVVGGFAAVVLVGAVIFSLLHTTWPAYAAAEPTKAYSLDMLFARLGVGFLCGFAGGSVATIIAGDRGRSALLFGALFLAASLYPHLVTSWADYPVWYHAVYLAYLIPAAALGGTITRSARR